MQPAMDANLTAMNVSFSNMHDKPKVKRLEVEDNIVLEVTLVIERLKLNVSCAANQIGATCMLLCKVQSLYDVNADSDVRLHCHTTRAACLSCLSPTACTHISYGLLLSAERPTLA